ncbi:unnamed protein product [Cuscuta epithymum]|uniref:DUF8040 domain-containing protein n=1 Tax=Cuscuta epithymum TaxID=186058 RepID=A0AAV0FJF7_9ASTE|nr:unnamed protein product [Cuscuta epithymum]
MAHGHSNRELQERFQHSGETICRIFGIVLDCLMTFSKDMIAPVDPTFESVAPDERYLPHFKDCIGAIDGTHVPAVIFEEKKICATIVKDLLAKTSWQLVALIFNLHLPFRDGKDQLMMLEYYERHWRILVWDFPIPHLVNTTTVFGRCGILDSRRFFAATP